jgi:hypothetical protein
MKKLITILALTLVTSGTFAQKTKSTKVEKETSTMNNDYSSSEYKPSKGTLTTEVGLTGGLGFTDYDLNTKANYSGAPMLRFRYFYKEDIAFRVGFSLVNRSNETDNVPVTTVTVPTPVPPATAPLQAFNSNKNSYSSFDINLGVEKHFKGTDRLSTYVGADILFGFRSASNESKISSPAGGANPNSVITEINVKGQNGLGNDSNRYFGLRVVSGADYYIAKKLYLGLELGLSLVSEKTRDLVTDTKITNATTNTVVSDSSTTVSNRASAFRITPAIVTGVRLGYQF